MSPTRIALGSFFNNDKLMAPPPYEVKKRVLGILQRREAAALLNLMS